MTPRDPRPLNKLAEARAAWAKLQRQRNPDCDHPRRGEFARRIADGSLQIIEGCPDCGADLSRGQPIPHRNINVDRLVLLRDDTYLNPPCVVCGAWGTQLHHWAPKEAFGGVEADHWPTSYLCVVCHNEWHKRIADLYSDAGRPF